MDVLVLGANDAGLEAVVDEMERAGHVVHRCAPPGQGARPRVAGGGRPVDARCTL
jgi:hypothetical protein